jgi:hypothetical protein
MKYSKRVISKNAYEKVVNCGYRARHGALKPNLVWKSSVQKEKKKKKKKVKKKPALAEL